MTDSTKHILRQLIKVAVFIFFILLLFLVGLVIGYGIIGDGKPLDVLKSGTWEHIFQFFK